MLHIQVVSHHFVKQNLIIASEWFQLGMIAQWKDSKETKQRKLNEQYEQQAMDFTNEIAYENEMVTI